MATLPPPFVKEFPADSLEKQVYSLVESLKEYIPIPNDRYRLSFSLFKYLNGEGDVPAVSVKHAKLTLQGITEEDLAAKLDEALKSIKK